MRRGSSRHVWINCCVSNKKGACTCKTTIVTWTCLQLPHCNFIDISYCIQFQDHWMVHWWKIQPCLCHSFHTVTSSISVIVFNFTVINYRWNSQLWLLRNFPTVTLSISVTVFNFTIIRYRWKFQLCLLYSFLTVTSSISVIVFNFTIIN